MASSNLVRWIVIGMTTLLLVTLIFIILVIKNTVVDVFFLRPVNKEISMNYYRLSTGGIVYCPQGNAFEQGKRKMPEVDKKTFMIIGQYFAKDCNYVYFKEKPIKNVDVGSFRVIADCWGKDKQCLFLGSIYDDCKTMYDVAVDNLEVLCDSTNTASKYLRNNYFVYFYFDGILNIVETGSLSSFVVLDSRKGLARDDKYYYKLGKRVYE